MDIYSHVIVEGEKEAAEKLDNDILRALDIGTG